MFCLVEKLKNNNRKHHDDHEGEKFGVAAGKVSNDGKSDLCSVRPFAASLFFIGKLTSNAHMTRLCRAVPVKTG